MRPEFRALPTVAIPKFRGWLNPTLFLDLLPRRVDDFLSLSLEFNEPIAALRWGHRSEAVDDRVAVLVLLTVTPAVALAVGEPVLDGAHSRREMLGIRRVDWL